jgi:hypothetical protein
VLIDRSDGHDGDDAIASGTEYAYLPPSALESPSLKTFRERKARSHAIIEPPRVTDHHRALRWVVILRACWNVLECVCVC